jgi:1-acyl-sn-glycerol-3-phosphate acyltransferase
VTRPDTEPPPSADRARTDYPGAVTDDTTAHPTAAASGRGGRRSREKTLLWHAIAVLLLPLLTLMAKYVTIDGHKLPKRGAFILAPNHYSEIDPIIMGRIMWGLGRVPRFLAKASVFSNPVIGAILRASGQIPVDRDGRSQAPLKAAQQLVDNELAVIIYPEGTLTRDPDLWPMRGKSGAVRMALQAGVPIIPAAHWGTQQIMARYSKKISFFPRKRILCKIGDPVDLSDLVGRPIDQALLAEGTNRVMNAIAELLGELREEQPPAERWDPVKNNQKETGRFD